MCRLEPGHLLGYGLDDTAVGKHQHQAREKKKKNDGGSFHFPIGIIKAVWKWPATADAPTAGAEPSADLGRDRPVGTGEVVGGHHKRFVGTVSLVHEKYGEKPV